MPLEHQTTLNESSVFPEPNAHHNALRQVQLVRNGLTLHGFSISGLSSYLQIPELDLCFDMGECPLSAVPLNHVFLTHAHGDHSRCLMRHKSVRKMIGIEKSASYYIPSFILDQAKEWIRSESVFEGVAEHKFQMPELVAVESGQWMSLTHRQDLIVYAFPVKHSLPSLGYTIALHKRKLQDEYIGLPAAEIIRLKNAGVEITREVREPLISFIGDCLGESLVEQAHIWQSPIVMIECTFLDEDEQVMARKKAHTHMDDVVRALELLDDQIQSTTIVLKHFSMKYSRKHILKVLEKRIPEKFRDRVVAFI